MLDPGPAGAGQARRDHPAAAWVSASEVKASEKNESSGKPDFVRKSRRADSTMIGTPQA